MHYRLRLVTVRMKVQQNGRLFIFLKRSDFSCASSWSICNKMDTLLGVSRAAVSKVMTTYTSHGKISGRRKSGRKPKLSERDRRTLKKIVSQKSWNYGSKSDSRTQYSCWRPCLHKTIRQELHRSNFHGRVTVAEPLVTENSAKRLKGLVW